MSRIKFFLTSLWGSLTVAFWHIGAMEVKK